MTPSAPARPECGCPPGTLSPSQIDTYRSCSRKWGFRKLAGQPEPEFSFQVAGKAIHDMLEKYALTGVLPERREKYATAVWNAVPFLPYPSPHHRCEKHIALRQNQMFIHGYPDLIPHDECRVVDYKTVSVRRIPFEFAHTPGTLRKDTQALVYAWSRADTNYSVDLKWIYIERAKPFRVRVVQADLTYEQLSEGMADIWRIAGEMYAHREVVKGFATPIDYVNNALPANTDFCGAYGGCPHMTYCDAVKKQDDNMSFQDMKARLAAMHNEAPATAAPQRQPDPINPPPPHEDVPDGEEDEEAAQIRALEAKRAAKAAAKAEKAAKAAAAANAEVGNTKASAGYETRQCDGTFTVTATGTGNSLEAAIGALKSATATL
jgi:hypothetical protein